MHIGQVPHVHVAHLGPAKSTNIDAYIISNITIYSKKCILGRYQKYIP